MLKKIILAVLVVTNLYIWGSIQAWKTYKSEARIVYVQKEAIDPFYGWYDGGYQVFIRDDLHPVTERFVRTQVKYLASEHPSLGFGGDLGSLIRATIYAGLREPLGCAIAGFSTITNLDRIGLYAQMVWSGKT